MSNWWDYGISGNGNTNDIATSSSIRELIPNTQTYELTGAHIVANVPLGETLSTTTEYTRHLVCATKGGTQIYLVVGNTYSNSTTHFYRPDENRHTVTHSVHILLKKGNSELDLYDRAGGLTPFIAGVTNARNYYKRLKPTEEQAEMYLFSEAFPRSESTADIACMSTNNGLTFYEIGYYGTQKSGNVYYTGTPSRILFTLPNTVLNNEFWFLPTDGLTAEQRDKSTGSDTDTRQRTYDYGGEDIDFPSLPSDNILGLGHYHIYKPSSAQIDNILSCLWFNPSEGEGILSELIETIKRFLFKPKDGLLSLMLYPFSPQSNTISEVYLGNFKTNVSCAELTSQWQIVDCGTLNVPLKYGSVLDYSPYLRAQVYLPFVGFRSINIDQLSGGQIHIKYYVDMLTGNALCMMRVCDNLNSNNSVLYSYQCNVSMQVPVSSDKFDSLIMGIATVGSSMASAVVGGKFGMAQGISQIPTAMQTASSSMQVDSGNMNGNNGMLSEFTPYIILEQPVQSLPSGYESQRGFPSNISASLSTLSGYTEVEKIHLNINCTDTELKEIESLLMSGVIL